MSKISIKKDFLDGTILPATDLNNNFMVIEAGINANEENLQEVIDEAIVRLDHELEEITADRGWDWNGGNRVTFYKGDTDAIEARDIINGQLLYNTETGETALDDSNNRIVTGSGNVVAIGETQPTNPATKLWVQPSKMARYAASYVVDDMAGDDTDKAPSVNAIKNYNNILTDGTISKAGYRVDGKDAYVKVLTISSLPNATQTDYPFTLPSNITIDKIESTMYFANGDTTSLPYGYSDLVNVSTPAYRKNDGVVRIVTTTDRSAASARIKFYFTYNN